MAHDCRTYCKQLHDRIHGHRVKFHDIINGNIIDINSDEYCLGVHLLEHGLTEHDNFNKTFKICIIESCSPKLLEYKENKSARDRLSEHLRFANNPNCNSYKEEALALHYTEKHSGISADFAFEILCIEANTVNRKILESYYISLIKPQINNKDECISIKQFLIV